MTTITITFSIKIELPKGEELQSTAEIDLESSVILSRSMPKQFELLILKMNLSRDKPQTDRAETSLLDMYEEILVEN